jgi:hypothetical protein
LRLRASTGRLEGQLCLGGGELEMEVSLEVVAAPMWVSPTQRVMLVDGEIWGREVKGSMWLTCRQVGERSERSDECDWEAGRKESEKVIEWQGEESKWLTGEQE